jgi:hypothetical protein
VPYRLAMIVSLRKGITASDTANRMPAKALKVMRHALTGRATRLSR